MNRLEFALMGIKRRFIGAYGSRRYRSESKYMPHQGAKQRAKYAKLAAKMAAKKDGE